MHFPKLSLLSLPTLPSLASALQASPADAAAQWTASRVHRMRALNSTVCTWHVEVGLAKQPSPSPAPSVCHFDVRSAEGEDCGQQNLGSRNCTGDAALSVSGGHSDQGFVVVVVVNEDEGSQAYFGFSDADLDAAVDIPTQTASVHPIHPGKPRREAAVAGDGAASGGAVWSVRDMFRHTDPSTHAVNVSFLIQDGNADDTPCELNLAAPEGVNLATWQWYDQKCSGSDWYASWGYTTAGDAGVMTLVNPARNNNAYFGFPNINSADDLGSAGPNPVSPCNCG